MNAAVDPDRSAWDVIVIGGAPPGENVAQYATQFSGLSGVRTVTVTAPDGATRTLTARHAVVLDSGSRATVPPVPGLAEARPWISRDATNLHEVPSRIVIVGGGVVACEAATWLHGLGAAEITIVEGSARLLAKVEPFAGEIIRSGFEAAGIRVRTGTRVASVSRASVNESGEGRIHGGEVTVTLSDSSTVVADEILVAAGRTPNSDDIGLASVGLPERGFLQVDEHLTVPGFDWLYAVGDLNGRALLTHLGKYQARIAGEVIAARASGTPLSGSVHRDRAAVPQVTFTDPEVGSVGATFVGTGIAELLHSATVAVVGKVPVADLWHAVPSYPTVSEIWLRLLETLDQSRRGK